MIITEPHIAAIGTATPAYKQNQMIAAEIIADALKMSAKEKRRMKSIYRATGITYRHSVLSDFCKKPGEYEFYPNDTTLPFPTTAERMAMYKQHATKLAVAAIEDCFQQLGSISFSQDQVTHLITISCTGMYAPGIDIEIQQALQLPSTIKRTCINFMGCYGAFNAIKVADAICRAYKDACVLIVCVELCTLHFQKNDTLDGLISNAIFADGAAAALITSKPLTKKYLTLKNFYCDLLPQYHQEMTWHIADRGFDIVLSSYVPQAINGAIAQFVDQLLSFTTLKLNDITWYAIHPGGYQILKACEKALKLTREQNRYAYDVLQANGNMSSATILFVLKAMLTDVMPVHNQQNIFSCAFGPGLSLESMVLQIAFQA